MRIRFALLLSVILIASGMAHASDLALTGAKIYTSPTDPPIENGSIVIRDGLIRSVGPSSTIKLPHSATIIDCKGLVVTEGFWNSHVHILPPALLHAKDSDAKQLDQQLDTMFNRWGFTTVFDIASVLDNTIALRRRIDGGEPRGPRILTVGEPIWTIEPVYVASLTTNPARKFGDSDHAGRVEKGMRADLVVLDGDPAQEVTAYSRVCFTIRNGEVIYKEQ